MLRPTALLEHLLMKMAAEIGAAAPPRPVQVNQPVAQKFDQNVKSTVGSQPATDAQLAAAPKSFGGVRLDTGRTFEPAEDFRATAGNRPNAGTQKNLDVLENQRLSEEFGEKSNRFQTSPSAAAYIRRGNNGMAHAYYDDGRRTERPARHLGHWDLANYQGDTVAERNADFRNRLSQPGLGLLPVGDG